MIKLQETVSKPKYLLTFAVGIQQKDTVNKMVSKVGDFKHSFLQFFRKLICLLLQFSEEFAIMMFHYDGKANEWDQFEWSQRAIHITASRQTKW